MENVIIAFILDIIRKEIEKEKSLLIFCHGDNATSRFANYYSSLAFEVICILAFNNVSIRLVLLILPRSLQLYRFW